MNILCPFVNQHEGFESEHRLHTLVHTHGEKPQTRLGFLMTKGIIFCDETVARSEEEDAVSELRHYRLDPCSIMSNCEYIFIYYNFDDELAFTNFINNSFKNYRLCFFKL